MPRSDDELRALLGDLETDLVERKESAAATDKIAQAICAYANDLPGHGSSGVVFVGATDDGRPSGLTVDDRLLLRLADIRDTGKILPLPHMRVTALEVGGARVAVVGVEPSLSPPVRYEGRVWIRVGPRRALASAPGGPYGAVTVENFGRPGVTDYRNPVLAEAMRNLGYVQRFGAGLQVARSAAQRNGNPPIEFTVDPSYVGLTLRRAP